MLVILIRLVLRSFLSESGRDPIWLGGRVNHNAVPAELEWSDESPVDYVNFRSGEYSKDELVCVCVCG